MSAAARPTGLALIVIVVGVLIAAVDTTIVILALPAMRADLHVGFASVVWVVLGYLLVITLLATQVGRLGDLFGRVRMYEAGFALFVLGSALCALSWNEASIIAFRVLQGVGGAFISANSGAVIADIFPPEARGRAYGFTSIGWNLGAVLGILAGGLLVTLLSWRWIFWINVPIGGGALLLALRVLDPRAERRSRRFDVAGMVSLGAGLFALLWAMVRLTAHALGATDVALIALGLVLLALFVWLEAHSDDPVVDLALFRVPTLAPSFLASLFQGLANFSVLFLVTMYLQGVRALTPLDAALYLVPGYLVGSVVGPVSGHLADRVGPAVPATLGIGCQIVALVLYAHLGLKTRLVDVSAISMVNGLGSGGFFPANNAAVMKASPRRVYGVASGLLRTFSNVGMIFSFSVALLVAARAVSRPVAFAIFIGTKALSSVAGADFLRGLHLAFYVSVAFLVVAVALSATRARATAAPLPTPPGGVGGVGGASGADGGGPSPA
jgi:EmrB/QacA subfamily drug resistance transporter